MSQDDDELQASAEVVNGIFQAAQDFCTQAIAGNADYEKIIRPFVEDQFDRHASVRAAKNDGERTLFWQRRVAGQEPQITRINKDNFLYRAIRVRHSFEEGGKRVVAIVQTDVRGITIQWPRPGGRGLRSIPICNIDCLHIFSH